VNLNAAFSRRICRVNYSVVVIVCPDSVLPLSTVVDSTTKIK
jgi:hypothetical protein